MIGHIKLDRKILDWEWYKDANVSHLFIYLILKANFKDAKWQGNLVKRGEVITGRLRISSDTGLSERQIRTCISKLKLTKEIVTRTTSRFTIITICKYDIYQSNIKDSDQQIDQPNVIETTNNRPTIDQQATTIEEELIRNKKNKGLEGENVFVFKLQKIYDTSWKEYSSVMNGQAKALDENKFSQWKGFVDFVRNNKFEDLFNAKFITPIEFEKLVSNGFTSEKWEGVLKSILATGIKPEHNLFFRIPQFMGYTNTKEETLSDYEKKLMADREKYKNKKYTE